MRVAAWIFGIGAMISLFLVYQQRDRRHLIAAKLCADVCWCVHYGCLGAFGGIVPNAVGIARELVFIRREDEPWANKPFIPLLFIAINWCVGALTFSRPINILPIAASTLVTVSLWLRRPGLTKRLSIPVSIAFLVYDLFVRSYIGVVNESLAIASIVIGLIKEERKRKV